MIGNATFLGNLYAFGAMLSFTLAHAAVIWMRRTMPDDMPWRGPLSFHVGGYDVPAFAILGGIGTGLVVAGHDRAPHLRPRGAGRLALAAFGMVLYIVYRKYQGLSLTETVLAEQAAMGPTLEVEYRSILMPIASGRVDDEMTATALKLAAESDTSLVVIYPIEVPLTQPISSPMEAETAEAERELKEAAALGREYGVRVITRIVRTRNIGEAIVEEADRRGSEIIVIGAGLRPCRAAHARAARRLRASPRQVPGDGRRLPAGG